jgi:hypothetical protein
MAFNTQLLLLVAIIMLATAGGLGMNEKQTWLKINCRD